MLYAGFTITATWLALRNLHLVRPTLDARVQYHTYFGVPLRYPFAVFGVLIATLGLVGDAIWHTVFGEEKGVARVIAPFHLVLFSGAALLLAAPIRSGWYATNVYSSRATFKQFFPVLLSLTLVVASVAFMEMPGSATTPRLRLRRSSSEAMADTEAIGADRTPPMRE